jgi:predicted DNA-binding protein (UPF0251 family)
MGFKPDLRVIPHLYSLNGNNYKQYSPRDRVVISDDEVKIMRWLDLNTPIQQHQLKLLFGVSKQSVCNILANRRRKVGIADENTVDRYFRTKDYILSTVHTN